MPSFFEFFKESSGKPIIYNNRIIHLGDIIEVREFEKLLITIESFDSKNKQGISFTTKGTVLFMGKDYKNKSLQLWQGHANESFEIIICQKDKVYIHNVWFNGSFVARGVGGAGMIIEKLDHGRRYYCNDGEPDDDFDDIVFRVERIGIAEEELERRKRKHSMKKKMKLVK